MSVEKIASREIKWHLDEPMYAIPLAFLKRRNALTCKNIAFQSEDGNVLVFRGSDIKRAVEGLDIDALFLRGSSLVILGRRKEAMLVKPLRRFGSMEEVKRAIGELEECLTFGLP